MTDKIQESGLSPAILVKLESAEDSIQPNDNVSILLNDAGYLTVSDIPATGVISVDGRTGIITLGDLYEPVVTQGTAYNKNYGTASDTVTQGNDGRLSDSRTPLAHTHTKSQISDFSDGDYATSAEGTLAASALQVGSNISDLTNNSLYVQDADIIDNGIY